MLPKGLLKEYWRVISMMIRCVDMINVCAAGWFAYIVKFNEFHVAPSYITAICMGTLLTPLVFSFFAIYESVRGKSFIGHFMHLLQAVMVMSLLLAGLAFFTKSGESYSRVWFAIWMVIAFTLLIFVRCGLLLCLHIMRARGLNERRVVIIGATDLGIKFAKTVQEALWTGFRIVSFIDDEANQKPKQLHGISVIQTPHDLVAYLTQESIDELWLALPLRDEARVKEILFALRHQTLTTRFVLDIFGLDLLNHSVIDIAGFPVINLRSTPMVGVNRFVKAIEDRILAACILLLISPLLLLIYVGIRCTSSGPVVFKQQRLGWDGRVIKIYKFRTMIEHAELDGCITQATANDQRVTRLGRFLRKTSLDELPQFFNVLQGRMSIVGPRPHALAHNELYKDTIHTYMQRHRVKPGITGWAQVNGWRGETDTLEKMEKRVEYDLYYINNWSLGFDLKIIFLTFFRGFISRNAY